MEIPHVGGFDEAPVEALGNTYLFLFVVLVFIYFSRGIGIHKEPLDEFLFRVLSYSVRKNRKVLPKTATPETS